MAYELIINAGYVHVRLYGHVTAADLRGLTEAAGRIESTAETTPHRITDLSEAAEMELNFSDMFEVASLRQAAKLRNRVRSAVVAKTPIQIGFARMFQTLNEHPQIEITLFQDAEAALQWILGEK